MRDPDATEPSKARRAAARSAEDEGADADGTLRGVVRLREGGAPVAGATVRLRLGEPDSCIDPRTGQEVPALDLAVIARPFDAETTTASDGRFSFGRAPEGAWRVVATGEGFAVGACTGAGPADVLIDVDAARTTRLFFKRRGTDVPVPGAEVLCWDGPIDGPPDARFVADDAASMTIPAHRSTTVLARAEGYATKIVSSIWGLGDVLVLMDPAEAVTGVVLLPEGSPVVGVEVRLQPTAAMRDPSPGEFVLRTHTSEDGRYRLPGLSEESPLLTIDVPGFQRFRARIGPGESELIVRLEQPAFAGVTVVDSSGAPFDDVSVAPVIGQWADVDPGATTALGDGRFVVGPLHPGIAKLYATPDDKARFETASVYVPLRPGERRRDIRIVIRERDAVTLRVRLTDGQESLGGSVVVTDPGRREWTSRIEDPSLGALFRLSPGSDVTVAAVPREEDLVADPPARVRAGTGETPAILDVRVRRGRAVRPRFLDAVTGRTIVERHQHTVTGHGVTSGTRDFTFAMLPDARFRLRAEVDGYAPYDEEHSAADVADGTLPVRLSRGLVVRGRIAGTGPEGTELHVEVQPVGGSAGDRTSIGSVAGDGTFELWGFGPGTWGLQVHCDGVPVHSLPFRLTGTGADLGEILLPALRILRGKVVDSRGRAIRGADIEVHGTHLSADAKSDAAGGFAVTLPASASVVVLARWRYDVARPGFAPPGVDGCQLVLEQSPRVLFRVPWPESERVQSYLREPRGAFEWRVRLSRTGDALRIADLPPGSWDVVFRRPTGDVVVRVDAAPGEIREIVVAE